MNNLGGRGNLKGPRAGYGGSGNKLFIRANLKPSTDLLQPVVSVTTEENLLVG